MGQHGPDGGWMIVVFIEIQRRGKILPPMRLCSGKMCRGCSVARM